MIKNSRPKPFCNTPYVHGLDPFLGPFNIFITYKDILHKYCGSTWDIFIIKKFFDNFN
jgi:hypothetical protein